jgi:hypothetical protein
MCQILPGSHRALPLTDFRDNRWRLASTHDFRFGSMTLIKSAMRRLAPKIAFACGSIVHLSNGRAMGQLYANATNDQVWFGGGWQGCLASVLRFCPIAASTNSSLAPVKPLSRRRSKRLLKLQMGKANLDFLALIA